MPEDTLDRIWGAIPAVCKSNQRQLRNEVALALFEFLGARRSEIFGITLSDALNGIETGEIIVYTKKREPGHSRRLDLLGSVSTRLSHYIHTVRTPLVEKAIKEGRLSIDHNMLLITTFGTPWNQVSFNNELGLLAKEALIETSISPHLFRHTHFSLLTERLRGLDDHKVRLILKKRGGWRSDMSVEVYQHADVFMAPDTKKTLNSIYSHVDAQITKRIIINKLKSLAKQVSNKGEADICKKLEEIESLVEQIRSETTEK